MSRLRKACLAGVLAWIFVGVAEAYPGPGTWSDVTPPDTAGSPTQLTLQIGSPHVYGIVVAPLTLGFSLDARMARWAFLTLSSDFAIPWISFAVGPSFMIGNVAPAGVRVLVSPRVGLDTRGGGASGTLDAIGLLDLPMAPGGAMRGWAGVKYTYGWGRDSTFAQYLFIVGGITAHVVDRLDLGLQVAGNPIFQTNGLCLDCCDAPMEVLTFTFQLGIQIGPVPDDRACFARWDE